MRSECLAKPSKDPTKSFAATRQLGTNRWSLKWMRLVLMYRGMVQDNTYQLPQCQLSPGSILADIYTYIVAYTITPASRAEPRSS